MGILRWWTSYWGQVGYLLIYKVRIIPLSHVWAKLSILVDVHGLTALHFATFTDNSDLVQKLLDHDDIQSNIEDDKGFTPVMSASFKGKTNALKVTDKLMVIWTNE